MKNGNEFSKYHWYSHFLTILQDTLEITLQGVYKL